MQRQLHASADVGRLLDETEAAVVSEQIEEQHLFACFREGGCSTLAYDFNSADLARLEAGEWRETFKVIL